MKNLFRLVALSAMAATLALPALAQTTPSQTTSTAPAGECTDQVKGDLYKKFTAERTKDPQVAYQAAKEYLQKCPNETDKIAEYLKKWVGLYEKEARKLDYKKALYNDKDFATAYKKGKEILAEEPENVGVLIDLGYGGYLATTSKVDTFNTDATTYAKKAIQLVESGKAPGKTPEDWKPFTGKDDALAWLSYTLGFMSLKNAPKDAVGYLIKAAQYESSIKKSPSTYYFLAVAYQTGMYNPMRKEFEEKYGGKDETPESKAALEKLNVVMDRVIDAYARAIAYATTPENAANKAEWTKQLTEFYKFRNNGSEAGLNELIAGVLSKPLPPAVTDATLTTPPATTTSTTTPSATSSSATDSGNGTVRPQITTPDATTTQQPASKTTTPATTTQPTSKPAAGQPSPKPTPSRPTTPR